MNASTLAYLAPGNEETEAVTTIDLLVCGGIEVTTASVASNGNLAITCSCGVKLLVDTSLVEAIDGECDVTVLPGGVKGAECFRDNTLLIETVKQFHRSGRIVTTICVALATVLIPHSIFPTGDMAGFPMLEDKIPAEQWQDKRTVWDVRIELLTSQGPDTATGSGLKIIDLLVRCEETHEVVSQLVMTTGIYNYYEQCRVW